MGRIRIPQLLIDAVDEDRDAARDEWLATLPETVKDLAARWQLRLGEPFAPGGQCAWVAPVKDRQGRQLVLKVGWRHTEAEHEADGLRIWDGNGTVRCFAAETYDHTSALLLERCVPGTMLDRVVAEPEQDVIVAKLLRQLWERELPPDHVFRPLRDMSQAWADRFELDVERRPDRIDQGLARAGLAALRELPQSATSSVLLCTDLHAGNILACRRQQWAVIDPKPYVGDPAYDPVQHMLNCDERLATDPCALSQRMADLTGQDRDRVKLWLFARCTQESICDASMREPARRLAS